LFFIVALSRICLKNNKKEDDTLTQVSPLSHDIDLTEMSHQKTLAQKANIL
jgi:hypothetical protein